MRYGILAFAVLLPAGLALLAGVAAPASAQLLPDYAHGVTIPNDTGAVATDLHVDLDHPATRPHGDFSKDFGSPTFTTVVVSPTALSLTWQGGGGGRPGTVPANGSATIYWYSKFAADRIMGGSWTPSNLPVNVNAIAFNFNVTDNPNGTITVAMNNASGNTVSYSGLQVFTGADDTFFTAPDYLNHASSGTSVSLLVADSGTLAPGATDFATFTPAATGYSVWSVSFDGLEFSEARGFAVPEPGSLALLASFGLTGAGFLVRRRKRAYQQELRRTKV